MVPSVEARRIAPTEFGEDLRPSSACGILQAFDVDATHWAPFGGSAMRREFRQSSRAATNASRSCSPRRMTRALLAPRGPSDLGYIDVGVGREVDGEACLGRIAAAGLLLDLDRDRGREEV